MRKNRKGDPTKLLAVRNDYVDVVKTIAKAGADVT